jgi:hypothetical protein
MSLSRGKIRGHQSIDQSSTGKSNNCELSIRKMFVVSKFLEEYNTSC